MSTTSVGELPAPTSLPGWKRNGEHPMKQNLSLIVRKFPMHMAMALALAMLLFAIEPLSGQSGDEGPGKLGLGLRELVELNRGLVAKGQPGINLKGAETVIRAASGKKASGVFKLQMDSQNRVLVRIHADGNTPLANIEGAVKDAGGSEVAVDATYSNGVIAAYIPVAAAEQLANTPGVRSLQLAHRAITHVGRTTSQGAVVMRTNLANQRGFSGNGITVGILSDSFNTSGDPDTALSDVNSGDLPNTTAIAGGEGLKFLIELDPTVFGPGTDEGRGMAQIVHDLAPNASLCFATAFSSEVDFANNIRTLRTNPACNADVIVDDVAYFDEPFFSDGILARAVDDVATSDTL